MYVQLFCGIRAFSVFPLPLRFQHRYINAPGNMVLFL